MPRKRIDIDQFIENGTKLTSPRSLEACLRSGIEPEELLPKKLGDFIPPGCHNNPLEREAAQIRYNHFEKLRIKKVNMAKIEHKKLCDEYGENSPLRPRGGGGEAKEPDLSKVKEEAVDSTMVALEEKRLERIKQRQEKEIQSLIEMESKTAEIQRQTTIRENQERKRKEQQDALRKEKRAEAAAHKRERELKKKQEEEQDVLKKRSIAKRQAKREKQILEEEKRQEVIRQKEALEREVERARKAEEHRKQTEALLLEQERIAMRNRERMYERERIIKEKMEVANAERQERALEKRRKAELRIQEALESNQAVMRRRKEEYNQKQAEAAERAREGRIRQQKEIKEQQERREKENKLRAARLKQARNIQKERVVSIVQRRRELDSHLDEVYHERNREHALRVVEKNLKLDEKKKNVERIKKIDEFVRLQRLQKIAENDAKSRACKMKKQMLLEARKTFALESQRRKHNIADAVEKMRVTNNWGSIDKLLGNSWDEAKPSTAGGASPRN